MSYIRMNEVWIVLALMAGLAGCYQPDTLGLSCLYDSDCLGLKCIGQVCAEGGGTGAVHVSVGTAQACAILGDGTARCWGSNVAGQLGYPHLKKVSCSDSPAKLGPLRLGDEAEGVAVVDIASGAGIFAGNDLDDAHTCALLANGRMKCWGIGSIEGKPFAGWLGYGDGLSVVDPALAPVVPLMPAVRSIALGLEVTCAIFDDGRLGCWGAGGRPLGNGGLANIGDMPGQIESLTPLSFGDNTSEVRTVSAGYEHTCATLADGTAWCWAVTSNVPAMGELGIGPVDPNDTTTTIPNRVQFGEDIKSSVVAVGAGYGFSCALLHDGEIACWGCNDEAALGLPDGHPSLDTVMMGCKSRAKSPLLAKGVNDALVGEEVRQLAVGSGHSCVRLEGGAVHCWGSNTMGQLGVIDSSNHATPVEVKLAGESLHALQISSGGNQSCAVLESGSVVCWGDNSHGQAGRGSCSTDPTPPQVVNLR